MSGCTDSTSRRVEYHTSRGDEYVRQRLFREAVIEYKNASQAAPQDASIHWKLAQAALESGDVREAFVELQRVIRLDPANDEAKSRLGQLHLARGQREPAANLAGDLVTHRPDSPLGYRLQADLSLFSGNVPDTLGHLHHAIDRDRANVPLMLTIANLYMVRQDHDQARRWYDQAVDVAPNSPDVHLARASHFLITGQEQAGNEAFRTAVVLSTNREDTLLAVAKQHLLLGRTAAAEQHLQALITEMNSHHARALLAELKLESNELSEAKSLTVAILQANGHDLSATYLDGRIALAERRFDDARALLSEVLHADARIAAAHLYLGVMDIIQGVREQGEQRLRDAIHLAPEDPRPHLILADLYLKDDLAAKAEEETLAVLRHHPWSLQAALLYGDSHAIRDHWTKAEEVYHAIAEHFPSRPDGYVKLATLKRRQGLTTGAAEYLAQAVRVSPADHALKGDYLLALADAGQLAKAKGMMREYLRTGPRDPGNWIAAGRLYVAQKQPARAEESFLTATNLAPKDPLISYQLGRFYIATGQRAKAVRCLEQTIEKDGQIAGVHTSLGILLALEGRVEEANRHYRQALDVMPDDLIATNNLATNLSEAGSLDEALPYAKRALTLAPSTATVQDTAGWILFRKGLIDEARPLMADAAGKLTDDPSVQYHHGMVLTARGENALAAMYLRAALADPRQFAGADQAKATLRSIE
ncbi:MAG: tetratricopeptide repeat protein [Nitrospirota bacterium]|nr:tetratricopeptide repeat protein [Nitrospirota bacterium]